jgi:secondary thiamine-phosphate synthase enzyme
MAYYSELPVSTTQRTHWVDITSKVEDAVRESGISTGTCTVSSLHTTAGVTINENADPSVGRDIFWKLSQLIPHNDSYRHSEGNSDSHLKTSLIGLSVVVPINNGRLVRGTWQGIYFCEFDGPRSRRVSVTIMGE